MSNYKVKVNNEAESKEVQELFFELGYDEKSISKNYPSWISNFNDLNGRPYRYTSEPSCKWLNKCEELTIQQLHDLVVLKRNDVVDATHKYKEAAVLKQADGIYIFSNHGWVESCDLSDEDLKPIEKEMKMKEYLELQEDGSYNIVLAYRKEGNDWIEVPEGAVALVLYMDDAGYWFDKENRFKGFSRVSDIGDFSDDDLCSEGDFSNYAKLHNIPVTWQRSEAEPTPNDQYAEIEQVRQELKGIEATLAERQATYGCFEDVARTTEQIMEALGDHRVNGLQDLPNTHRMALYMIASKMSRIVNGDFNHRDSWHDIGGYAKLVEDLL